MKNEEKNIDEIISFAKEKGFVFQSSEIYGGLAGVYDFGPLGVELLNNIKKDWWKANVQKKMNYFGLDSAMFKDPRVWDASGHTSGFSDPMAECKDCNSRIRVDKELENIGIDADEKMSEKEINELFFANIGKIKCKKCGGSNFSEAKNFNLLVKSNLGDFTSKGDKPVYLPGEACQGIYLNYKNVVDSMHPKIPFGIAQIGKAFRNEISPRNFLFRTREFEQADTQFFVRPEENKEPYEKIKKERWQWYLDLGLSVKNLLWSQHKNLVFYASDAWDIEYNFPTYGFDEMEGIHDRTDYDLSQHSKFSGVDLSFNDNGEKFIPWVLETSMGMGRVFLAVLSEAYDKEKIDDEERRVLRLLSKLAPVKVAILPLVKKDGLKEEAYKIYEELSEKYNCVFSDTATVGKRYRKQDEIGTPFCVTYDYESKEDNSVTVRERDSMKQERVKIGNLGDYLNKLI
ncbi:MAG: glycine--tRNA ligase [Candidatus Pacebacteria bacterium]|nr:glycine--tRNA ligase [Candidatus Paceibacterota bacterium]